MAPYLRTGAVGGEVGWGGEKEIKPRCGRIGLMQQPPGSEFPFRLCFPPPPPHFIRATTGDAGHGCSVARKGHSLMPLVGQTWSNRVTLRCALQRTKLNNCPSMDLSDH